GLTFSFDPNAIMETGPGMYTLTYTYTNPNTNCTNSDEVEIEVFDMPTPPVTDMAMDEGCVGQTAGTISVNDPGAGFLIYWEVLEAPAGATIMAGDLLAPNTSDSHYRTNLGNNGEILRIKSDNGVTPGLYRFCPIKQDVATGCFSGPSIEGISFEIYMNEPPAAFTETLFDDGHCYGEPDNLSRRVQVGPPTLPGVNEEVVWRIVSFTPGTGSDTPNFGSGEYTMADNTTTDAEFEIKNDGRSFRPVQYATGMNGNPLYGTYELEVFVRNTEVACEGQPYTVFKTIYGLPSGTFDNTGPVCANEIVFLTYTPDQGTGPGPYMVKVTELANGNYTYGGPGPFWTFNDPNNQFSATLPPGMHTFTLTAIKDANGCETTGLNLTTTIEIAPEPAIECPGNLEISTSNNGEDDCTADGMWTHPTELNGACEPQTLTLSIDGGDPVVVNQGEATTQTITGVGDHTITYLITDDNNNTDECSFTVTVVDDEKPKYNQGTPDQDLYTEDGADCPNADGIISLTADQNIPLTVGTTPVTYYVAGLPFQTPNDQVTDNCTAPEDIEMYVWSIDTDYDGLATDYYRQIRVIFRIYDENGNHRNRDIIYTIRDNTPPVIECVETFTLDFNGE
ncbi:MAG: HYR domain-containing protein, partial [Lewinella sp.]|nr:HYR domain-containing protein [Lewinella sp.]